MKTLFTLLLLTGLSFAQVSAIDSLLLYFPANGSLTQASDSAFTFRLADCDGGDSTFFYTTNSDGTAMRAASFNHRVHLMVDGGIPDAGSPAYFSLSFWYKRDTMTAMNNGDHTFFAGIEELFNLYYLSDSIFVGQFWQNTPSFGNQRNFIRLDTMEMNANDWYHIAYVKAQYEVRLYLNGALAATVNLPTSGSISSGQLTINTTFGPAPDPLGSNRSVRIATGENCNPSKPFSLDEFRYYFGALTDAEVSTLYTAGVTATAASTATATGTFQLYPNPAQNYLTVSLPTAVQTTARIYTLQGQLVQQQPIAGMRTDISVSSLVPGVYILEVAGQSQRFVKQ